MSDSTKTDLARYARQIRYPPIGEAGQRKLLAGRVLVCGCGALGSVLANTLVRAGVGHVRIVDRDFVELTNLQRQVLFDEDDLAAMLPKAIAAAHKLRRINSTVEIEPMVADIDSTNILSLCEHIDVIVDGTDNFETRFLINDAAAKLQIPWVYGGSIGAEGQSMTIVPDELGCLRCLMPEPPPRGSMPTCDTAGILGSAVNLVASVQACEAIKLLVGDRASISRSLMVVDLWDNQMRRVKLDRMREQGGCPTCRREEFPWLSGEKTSQSAILCGRNAVQLSHTGEAISLDALAEKLSSVGKLTKNRYLLRLAVDDYLLTVFPDGRAIVGGTEDPAVARGVYAKYVGG